MIIIKKFWIKIWKIIKSMGSVRGVLALLLTWLVLSGAGLIIIGWVTHLPHLVVLGTTIYGFWLLPLTPLIPITIAVAIFVQRYIFMDRKGKPNDNKDKK